MEQQKLQNNEILKVFEFKITNSDLNNLRNSIAIKFLISEDYSYYLEDLSDFYKVKGYTLDSFKIYNYYWDQISEGNVSEDFKCPSSLQEFLIIEGEEVLYEYKSLLNISFRIPKNNITELLSKELELLIQNPIVDFKDLVKFKAYIKALLSFGELL